MRFPWPISKPQHSRGTSSLACWIMASRMSFFIETLAISTCGKSLGPSRGDKLLYFLPEPFEEFDDPEEAIEGNPLMSKAKKANPPGLASRDIQNPGKTSPPIFF